MRMCKDASDGTPADADPPFRRSTSFTLTSLSVHRLTKAQARRIAVRAQLLDAPRPTELLPVVQQLTLLQIDPTAAVAPKGVVVADPGGRALVATRRPRAGEDQAEVAHRSHEGVVLEQRAVLFERLLQMGGLVRRAETAPGDEVRARRNGRGRVDLQQRQLLHDGEQLVRPRRVE